MIPCQHCSTRCNSPKDYTEHLKAIHLVTQFGEFQCLYENCVEKFHALRKFRDHLKNHFDRKDQVSVVCLPQSVTPVPIPQEVPVEIPLDVEFEEPIMDAPMDDPMNEEENEDYFDVNDTILKSVLHLVLELHSAKLILPDLMYLQFRR